ncbi:hypothetical protein [Halobacillus litoralis]|uniref:YokE-like PH domain-containing protein n=1 Tax=Halobacillus litoralis TaxID=45668 RepID=A0A410MAK2_9BACI|nr:hypothetical protein [Halobacillus litoralis]QAS51745.1 hypothetical protein HLI_05620 [Halobacillus litoralis]
MICSQSVFVKTRVIENNQQHYIEHQETLDLYEDEIVTPTEKFVLKDVHDVSYKGLTGTYGFLYLHTIKGVRTYMVKEHPAEWMESFRALF